MAELKILEIDGGVVFEAKIVPGASGTVISGLFDGMVKIKVSAAPEKGKANQCLVEFLAGKLGVKKGAVSIISGQRSPRKRVQVVGVSAEMLLKKLGIKN